MLEFDIKGDAYIYKCQYRDENATGNQFKMANITP